MEYDIATAKQVSQIALASAVFFVSGALLWIILSMARVLAIPLSLLVVGIALTHSPMGRYLADIATHSPGMTMAAAIGFLLGLVTIGKNQTKQQKKG